MAGLRLVNILARWALTAITGRTTWPQTLKVPTWLRRQLCADLGWDCLWLTCKVSAIALHEKCRADNVAFSHARLCAEGGPAAGGWMAATQRIMHIMHIPGWQPEPGASCASLKLSLAHYRRTVIRPSVIRAHHATPANPPLPWAWIASCVGTIFSQESFTLWWHLRVLGQPFPTASCPWCDVGTALTAKHLQSDCILFATACWSRSIRPEDVFI